jgi:uridylate kinase
MSGVVQYTNIIRIDLNLKEAFSLSPNPAQNYLQVSITSAKNQEMKLAIVGAAGQIIRTEKLSVKAGNNVITLDYISTLQSGTYMLALTSDGNTQWKKFIVTNTPRKF